MTEKGGRHVGVDRSGVPSEAGGTARPSGRVYSDERVCAGGRMTDEMEIAALGWAGRRGRDARGLQQWHDRAREDDRARADDRRPVRICECRGITARSEERRVGEGGG